MENEKKAPSWEEQTNDKTAPLRQREKINAWRQERKQRAEADKAALEQAKRETNEAILKDWREASIGGKAGMILGVIAFAGIGIGMWILFYGEIFF